MLFKVLAVAGWAAVSVTSMAQAQSLAGPAENPPSGFKGSQYVDSRGCVFLRAGIGGRTNWVPRISANRKALCGFPPTFGGTQITAAEPAPAPAPAPVVRRAAPTPPPAPSVMPRPSADVGKPMETIASLPRTAPRRVAPAPAPKAVAAPVVQAPQRDANAVARNSACPSNAPYGARVTMNDGRRSLLCSASANFDPQRAAQRIQTARQAPVTAPAPSAKVASRMAPAPAYVPSARYRTEGVAAGGGYQCPASAPVARRYELRSGGSTVMCTTAGGGIESATPPLALGNKNAVARDEVVVPKGYKKAWKDDRLNPNRGKGTARGQAQQDQVWTRDIPAELVADQPVTRKSGKKKVYVTSTSNAPRAPQPSASGRDYVQVGTFGEPANAARSAARLQGMGLPVAKSRITSKGRAMQIVMAGPFGDRGAANAALAAARRSGFGDAFIR